MSEDLGSKAPCAQCAALIYNATFNKDYPNRKIIDLENARCGVNLELARIARKECRGRWFKQGEPQDD
jgi:hypothetical protein